MARIPAVTKAVIPAAGLGTRFLPATKAIPKEMLPVVDKPAIQYVVEEAVAAGLRDILLVTASSTTYWMAGLSTTGSISLGIAFVAGRNRVPSPAAGMTAFVTAGILAMSIP